MLPSESIWKQSVKNDRWILSPSLLDVSPASPKLSSLMVRGSHLIAGTKRPSQTYIYLIIPKLYKLFSEAWPSWSLSPRPRPTILTLLPLLDYWVLTTTTPDYLTTDFYHYWEVNIVITCLTLPVLLLLQLDPLLLRLLTLLLKIILTLLPLLTSDY